MKRNLILILLTIISSRMSAQSAILTSFEINSQSVVVVDAGDLIIPQDSLAAGIAELPDNTPFTTSIIVSVDHPSSGDSLFFTITDSRGILTYSAGNRIDLWKAGNADRTADNVLYLTVDLGQYAYMKHFTAVAELRPSTGAESMMSFNKAN